MASGSILGTFALVSTLLMTVVEPQAPLLDVKSGLWEITTSMQIRGQIALNTSQMTPEMKSVVEESMKKVTGKTYTSATNQCDKVWLAQWLDTESNPPGLTCTRTLTSNTPSSLDVTLSCSGPIVSVSQIHLGALSTSSFKGTITTTNTDNGQISTTTAELTGKWLRADCGSDW